MGDFREHYIGGLVVYTTFFVVSMGVSLTGIFLFGLPQNWNPTVPMELLSIAFCFVISLLCSLWPDVDIKSKSQQIFYALFAVSNLVLILKQEYRISAFFGLFAMLPMLGKHRGWTHSRLTMILFPALFVLVPIGFQSGIDRPLEIWKKFGGLEQLIALKSRLPFYVAGVVGYATHLQVDAILLPRSKKRA